MPDNGHAVPAGPHWVYEIKHDGYRFICRRDGDSVRVFSRRGNDWIVEALQGAQATRTVSVEEGNREKHVVTEEPGKMALSDLVYGKDLEKAAAEVGKEASKSVIRGLGQLGRRGSETLGQSTPISLY